MCRIALLETRSADRARSRRRHRQATHEHVERLRVCGESPPTPLSERRYSGTFSVRTSPELHGRLALEAIEQGVSMNQWIVQKLSGRAPSSTFGLSGFD